MKSTKLVSAFALFLALVLASCNLPSNVSPTEGVNAVLTEAAKTVEANLTQSAILSPPTVPGIPTTPAAPPTVALSTAAIPSPTPIPTQDCDNAEFVTDVTIPDGTVLEPNDNFTKTWRLKNVGTCSWTTSYATVFSSGDKMNGPNTQALAGNTNPGQTVDISVNLKAPPADGNYRGYWNLRNASGVLFAQFYVDIKVQSPAPPPPTPTATNPPHEPDLYISQITYNPANPHKGDVITIKVSVYNGGNAPAGPSTAEWWPAAGYPNAECTWAVSSLVAHGGKVYTCTYTYAGWSTYTTRAIADSANAVVESEEGNNILEQTLTVGP